MHFFIWIPFCFLPLRNAAQDASYEKLWETRPELMAPAALAFDSQKMVYYVANKNKSILDPGYDYANRKDGFISKVSSTGEIIQLKWIEGFEEPSDLVVKGNKLYVVDGDNFNIVDIPNGKISSTINTSAFVSEEKNKIKTERIDSRSSSSIGPPPEVSSLSSVVVLPNGRIFLLDSGCKSIYELIDNTLKMYLKNQSFEESRKIVYDEDTNSLFVLKAQQIYSISLKDKTLIDTYINQAFPAWGIIRNGREYLVINSFNKVFSLRKDEITKLFSIDEPCKCNTDIESIGDGRTITVLISSLNKLISYNLK
jgi:hypothetical protein